MSEPTTTSDDYETFLRFFTRDQYRILSYIRSIVVQPHAVDDVYQETCLELWRSFSTFQRDGEFVAWALGVTRNQILKHWRTRDRDRLVFSDALLHEITATALEMGGEMSDRQEAMNECVKKLAIRQRELIHLFYGKKQSAAIIAEHWNRSVHAIYKALKVMRRTLFECVESKLGNETA